MDLTHEPSSGTSFESVLRADKQVFLVKSLFKGANDQWTSHRQLNSQGCSCLEVNQTWQFGSTLTLQG